MKSHESCRVVNALGLSVAVFRPDETFSRKAVYSMFGNKTEKENGFVVGEVACVFLEENCPYIPEYPKGWLELSTRDYDDNVCLMFKPCRTCNKYWFLGVFLFDRNQQKHIRQCVPVTITTDGMIVCENNRPNISFGPISKSRFGNVSIGISQDGSVSLKKEKGCGTKLLELLIDLIPILLILGSCFWIYTIICTRVTNCDSKVSWQVNLADSGTNTVSGFVQGTIAGHNLTNLTIRVNQ